MERYDAVICGAGPSGSTAAMFMAKKGLKVAVLEKSTFPRDKPCGGALRPSIIREFKHIRDVLSKIPFTECKRAKMFQPDLSNHVDYRPGKVVMYNIQRKYFDNLLLDLARDANAEIHENQIVKSIVKNKEGLTIQTKNGSEFFSRLVIGAGGMHDPVAMYLRKSQNLPRLWPKSKIGLAVMEEFEVDDEFILDRYGEERTCYFHLKPHNFYGYAWTFPKKDALNIGYGAFWKYMKDTDIKKQFDVYLTHLKKENLVPENVRIKNIKGAPIPLRGAQRPTYTEGILLVGDSAGFVSPLGGDGLYYAVDSGRIAADVALHAHETNSYQKETLSGYENEWHRRWGRDLEVMCYFADYIFENTERIINYASKDEVFKEMAVCLYNGEESASDLKLRIKFRAIRDFLLFDVLKRR